MTEETRIGGGAQRAGQPLRRTPAPIRAGDLVLNSYRIVREIARGGMGALYEGRHDITGERVAIKAVLDELLLDQRAIKLFEREAMALRAVQHEAVVRYRDILRDEAQRLYIIMDFVDGEPMSNYSGAAVLPPSAVEVLGLRLASGLSAAHAAGVIHRDLSPKNILLPGGDIERAVIIDFGIARNTASEDGTMIGDAFAGTLRYAAPEQLGLFGGKVDQRADIYSLGLILAEAAGAELDLGATVGEAAVRRQRDVAPPSGLPPSLHARLERMLRARPTDRPESVGAAWSGEKAAAPTPLIEDDLSKPPQRARSRRPWLAAAAAAAALLAAGGWWVFGGGPDFLKPEATSVRQTDAARLIIERVDAGSEEKLAAADALVAAGGVDNLNVAVAVFRKLSELGSGEASARLARMYDPDFYSQTTSPFSRPNPSSALRWYRKAAEQGHADAATRIMALESK